MSVLCDIPPPPLVEFVLFIFMLIFMISGIKYHIMLLNNDNKFLSKLIATYIIYTKTMRPPSPWKLGGSTCTRINVNSIFAYLECYELQPWCPIMVIVLTFAYFYLYILRTFFNHFRCEARTGRWPRIIPDANSVGMETIAQHLVVDSPCLL